MNGATRREAFFVSLAALELAACADSQPANSGDRAQALPRPQVIPRATPLLLPQIPTEAGVSIDQQIKREVQVIAFGYPEAGTLFRSIYLGDLSKVNPLFTVNLMVGVVQPGKNSIPQPGFAAGKTAAETRFTPRELSPTNRFDLIQTRQTRSFQTVRSVLVETNLPAEWLTLSDDVKTLVLEKEATRMRLYGITNKTAHAQYLLEGAFIGKRDATVTETEVDTVLGNIRAKENPTFARLADYAAVLPILSNVGIVLNSGDVKTIEELRKYTTFQICYDKARELGIDLRNMNTDSEAFVVQAFSPQSRWVQWLSQA